MESLSAVELVMVK